MLNNNVQKFSMGHSFDDDYFRYFLYTISQSDAPTHQSSVLIWSRGFHQKQDTMLWRALMYLV